MQSLILLLCYLGSEVFLTGGNLLLHSTYPTFHALELLLILALQLYLLSTDLIYLNLEMMQFLVQVVVYPA